MIAARRTFIALLSLALGLQWALAALAAEPAQRPTTDIHQTMLQTWREDISAPDDKQAKYLSQAVRQLQAMVLPSSQSQVPVGQTKPAAGGPGIAGAPSTASAAAGAAEAPLGSATQPTTQPDAQQGISPADLAQLKSMELEKLLDAAGTADAIYQAGQHEAALAIYQRLSDHPPAGVESRKGASRDWLLFQLANCNARLGRYEEAAKLYQQLITSFPDSPWVAVAKVQGALAGWHQAEKPADLFKQVAEPARQPRGAVGMK